MSECLLSGETPVEFFREQLGKAMEHQRVSTSAFTEFYLVNLLAACIDGESLPRPETGFDEMPLAAPQGSSARLFTLLGSREWLTQIKAEAQLAVDKRTGEHGALDILFVESRESGLGFPQLTITLYGQPATVEYAAKQIRRLSGVDEN